MSTDPSPSWGRAAGAGPWLCGLACVIFAGEAIGCTASLGLPLQPSTWGIFAVVALLLGGVVAFAIDRTTLRANRGMAAEIVVLRRAAALAKEAERSLATQAEQQRKLRHDIRGALSPAMLTADRLLRHADPAVQRSGDIMVRCVDRAAALLSDSVEDAAVEAR